MYTTSTKIKHRTNQCGYTDDDRDLHTDKEVDNSHDNKLGTLYINEIITSIQSENRNTCSHSIANKTNNLVT